MKSLRKPLILLLVFTIAVSMFSGCKARNQKGGAESSSKPSSSSKPESKPAEGDKKIADAISDMMPEVQKRKTENEDTVGWVQIPELGIGDVVVCNYESNEYYRRRNFNKQEEFNGVLYADKRSVFGDGTAKELGVNTCIYGHTLTNIKTKPDYKVFLGPLFELRDQNVAKSTPYIYFSTEKENLVYEIFAVFIANNDNLALPYNRNDIPPDEFREMVKKEVLPRSLYNYNVELKDDDKFLTLSTCLYRLPDGTQLNYKTTYYRYAVMARLVDPNEPLKAEADFALNPNPLMDPDGPMASKQ